MFTLGVERGNTRISFIVTLLNRGIRFECSSEMRLCILRPPSPPHVTRERRLHFHKAAAADRTWSSPPIGQEAKSKQSRRISKKRQLRIRFQHASPGRHGRAACASSARRPRALSDCTQKPRPASFNSTPPAALHVCTPARGAVRLLRAQVLVCGGFVSPRAAGCCDCGGTLYCSCAVGDLLQLHPQCCTE